MQVEAKTETDRRVDRSPVPGSEQRAGVGPDPYRVLCQLANSRRGGSRPRGALRVFSGGPTWARRDAAQPLAERLRGQVGAVRPREGAQLRIDAHLREIVGIAERLEDAAPVAAGERDFADGPSANVSRSSCAAKTPPRARRRVSATASNECGCVAPCFPREAGFR
jgi:hypothetical protein